MAEIAKHHIGATPGYRLREKACARCGQPFDTVELPQQVFAAFLREFETHRKGHFRVLDAIEALKRALDLCLFPRDAKIYETLLRIRATSPKKKK